MGTEVSVIIPVYNAEKYLRQCLDSVLAQSLGDIEIICIDDCSADGSPAILREYAARDARMRVVYNEKNMHAGICRNLGLNMASGEYVMFLDADDWILPDALKAVCEDAHKTRADMLRCKALDYNNESGEYSESFFNSLKRVPKLFYGRAFSFGNIYRLLPKLNVAPWGGLYRREFLTDNKILFNDLVCVNDRSFYWECAIKAGRIAFSKTKLVAYRTNMSASLVGGRIRNFDCHFRSYEIVRRQTEGLPRRMRETVLDAELRDLASWLKKAMDTEYCGRIKAETKDFIGSINGLNRSVRRIYEAMAENI